jgi:hypothetical protein
MLSDWHWQQAKAHMTHMGMCYSGLYFVSSSEREKQYWQTVIRPLEARYYGGERTQELYDAIMAIGDD